MELDPPDGLRLGAHQMGQGALGRQATHHDEMIEGLTSHRDVGDAQIHIGGQASVEIDLASAVFGPSRQGREVGEVKSERLAQFEHMLPEEQQDRHVRLTHGTTVRELHRRACHAGRRVKPRSHGAPTAERSR